MTFFKKTDGFCTAHGVGNAVDEQSGKQHGFSALPNESLLHGHAVDYGRQHAHVVALNTVEPLAGTLYAAENIAASNDDADLDTFLGDFNNLFGVFVQAIGVDAKLLLSHKGFAAEL